MRVGFELNLLASVPTLQLLCLALQPTVRVGLTDRFKRQVLSRSTGPIPFACRAAE
jgi:hypothetical protein